MKLQKDGLRLQQHERSLENERKKGDADEEQMHWEIELTQGSSRAFGLQVESVGSRRKLERTAGWAKSLAQQSGPSRHLSPNVLNNPTMDVTQDGVDKRFTTYPKTTPLFQTGEGLFSTQLTEPIILKKTEIHK